MSNHINKSKRYAVIADRKNSWIALNKTMVNKNFNKRIKNAKTVEEGHLVLKEAFANYKTLTKGYQVNWSLVNKYQSYKHMETLSRSKFRKIEHLRDSWINTTFLSIRKV